MIINSETVLKVACESNEGNFLSKNKMLDLRTCCMAP